MEEQTDPFAFIDEECGTVSSSQEDFLLHSTFLNEPPSHSLPHQHHHDDKDNDNDIGGGDDEGTTPLPIPPADSPILICSPPPSPTNYETQPLPLSTANDPAKEPSSQQGTSFKNRKKKSKASKRRSRAPQLRSSDSDREKEEVVVQPSITTRNPERRTPEKEKGKAPHPEMPSFGGNSTLFPANLLDVVNAFSRKPDMRFANTDILEIAAMKGIHFPPPKWWRPGGYD